uniref:Uncharacterized protein n=1 Tax=Geospiza parvula TaxID=87175 RepID=A0A8C3NGV4_GEOPR
AWDFSSWQVKLVDFNVPSFLSLLPLGVSPSSAQGEGTPQPHHLAKGRNVMLPCSFSPEQHAQDTEVTWVWEQLSPFVHRHRCTELLKDGPAQGSTHLKIFHVQLSDRGNYTCDTQQDIPESFNPCCCVLGCDGFTFRETLLGGEGDGCRKMAHDGDSTEDVKNKNDILWLEFKPEKGRWAGGLLAEYFLALTSPDRTLLPEISTPRWIWICLDYKERWIYCRTVISFKLAVKNSFCAKDINLVSFANEVNSLAPSLCPLPSYVTQLHGCACPHTCQRHKPWG